MRKLYGYGGRKRKPDNSRSSTKPDNSTPLIKPDNSTPSNKLDNSTPPFKSANSTLSINQLITKGSGLWDEAFTQVQATKQWQLFLKITERSTFEKVQDPQAVAGIVQKVQEQAQASQEGRSRALRETCSKVLSILNQINDVATAAASLNPYASLGWSVVKFLVQASLNNREVQQFCWQELPHVTSLIVRHQTLEELYNMDRASTQSQKLLRDSVVQMYFSILQYEIQVVIQAGSKMARFKTFFTDPSNSGPKQASESIEIAKRDVFDLQAIVDREISDGQFKELSAKADELKAAISSLEALSLNVTVPSAQVTGFLHSAQKDEILKWLSTYLHENSHKKVEKTGAPGTGLWLLTHEKFRTWFSSPSSSSLWLKGFMGSGKSCLTHIVIEYTRTRIQQNPEARLAFFYFDGTDQTATAEMADPDKVMRSILKQLAIQEDSVHESLQKSWDKTHNSSFLTAAESVDLLLEVSANLKETCIIFDGFDEATESVQRDLAAHFRSLLSRATGVVRLFVSGRPSVEPRLHSWISDEVNVRDNNRADFALVVKAKVAAAADSDEFRSLYWIDTASRADEVVSLLEDQADGMFRWVVMALNYLHKSKHYAAMTKRLRSLPDLKDLLDLYATIWEDALAEADEDDKEIMRLLILFAMYGHKPPEFRLDFDRNLGPFPTSTTFVVDAVDFLSEPTTEHTKPSVNSLRDLAGLCPDFLEHQAAWNEDEKQMVSTLRLQHFSVREFFRSRCSDQYSPLIGNAYLAQLCINSWLASTDQSNFKAYSGYLWGDYLIEVKLYSNGDLQGYLRRDTLLAKAIDAFLRDEGTNPGFETWTAWITQEALGMTLDTQGAAADWATVPASTIRVRDELGLS